MENELGLTLKEILEKYPELQNCPQLNEYGFSAESMFEMMAKQLEQKTGLIAKRNNREDIYAVDFSISDKKNPDNILCYVEVEADYSGTFEQSDVSFKHRDLSIPGEKKKYFFRDKPCFYLKFSKDFKWCYIIDVCSCKHLFSDVNKNRKDWNGNVSLRYLWEAKSNVLFRKNEPYGIHRLQVQDWLIIIAYFLKLRYSQTKLGDFFQC